LQEILPKTTENIVPSTETKNVAALLQHLVNTQPTAIVVPAAPLPVQQLQFTPQSLKPKNECLQFVEVLTMDEKINKLLDLFSYMATLKQYKRLKVIICVRGLTSDRTEQFDNLLKSEFKLVRRQFGDFSRFYAYVQCPVAEIQLSLKAFADCGNGVLITDVDSRYLGINTADFLIFYDSPSSSEIYMDSLSRFNSENSSHTIFVTFLLASDCNLTKALPRILGEFNHVRSEFM
jgi:superfamily II DNA/RNA helicase